MGYYNDDTAEAMRRIKRREKILRERKRRQRQRIIKTLCGVLLGVIVLIVAVTIAAKIKNKEEVPSDGNIVTAELDQLPSVDLEPTLESVYEFSVAADSKDIDLESVISSNAILVNAENDTIVASKGSRVRISPASMTKVLTILVAAEHIPAEKLQDTFTMTLEITDYSYENECSNVGFSKDEVIPIEDLFYGTILSSGADAALGLAYYVSGSHEAFMDLMNQKLEELGLSESSHFTNCVGIYDDNHYSTVYDMAIIMKAALDNELCKKVLSTRVYETAPTAEHPEGLTISNWFIRRIEDKEVNGTVLGAKTGYVVESGNCAISYGEFAGETEYICVTAGSSSNWRCIYDHVDIYNQYAK